MRAGDRPIGDASALDWPRLIVDSYRIEVGGQLCEASDLLICPAVVLCHDIAPDPCFVYANRSAQHLWGRTWDAFIGMPSRLTADPEARADRARALAQRGQVVRGYSGVRVRSDGSHFRIENATVWPVRGPVRAPVRGSDDAEGEGQILVGQAATFTEWVNL